MPVPVDLAVGRRIAFSFVASGAGRRGLACAAALALLSLGLGGCGQSADAQGGPPPAPPVSAAPAVQRTVVDSEEFSGRLEASDYVELRPRVSGTIERIHFTDGAVVQKGQLLFTIDPRPFEAEAARAQSQLAAIKARADLAQSELARAKTLARFAGDLAPGVRPADVGHAHLAGRHPGRRGGSCAPRGSISNTPRSARRSPGAPRAPTSPSATWSTTSRC